MTNIIYDYFELVKNTINSIDNENINIVKNIVKQSRRIYIIGNGGSASTASHFACDLQKRQNIDAVCLSDNIALVTAYSNDINYQYIYKEQLDRIIRFGDVVVGISGSGNSKNILTAIESSNRNNIKTVSLTGFDGGYLKNLSNFNIHVPIDNMQVVEDIHLMICHILSSD